MKLIDFFRAAKILVRKCRHRGFSTRNRNGTFGQTPRIDDDLGHVYILSEYGHA